MIDFYRYSAVFKWLNRADRIRAAVRRRNGGRPQADRNLAAFYEALWRDAAAVVGADIEPLGCGAFEIRRGTARTRVLENTSAMDDLITHVIVRTKPVVYRLLAQQELPTPRFREFAPHNLAPAIAFLQEIGRDCVVKPASDTGGGLGVTTGIRSRWHLARAAWAAARHGDDLLIEEQISGDNYRLLYLDGRLLDAVVRRPPTVCGDGRSNIETLVQAINKARLKQDATRSHSQLTVDMDMQNTLQKQNLTLASVPRAGQRIIVKTAINENSGEDNESVNHLLSKALIEQGARAARATGVRLAGVDVITSDPSLSLHEAGGVILEVNSPPGYFWHYQKRDGAFPIAVHVLQTLLNPSKQEASQSLGEAQSLGQTNGHQSTLSASCH